jgi:thioredoxin 1
MLTVYDFWAEWCGPCKVMKSTIDELIAEHNTEGSGVNIVKVDVDSDSPLLSKFNIATNPTQIFEKGGVEVARLSGAVAKTRIQKLIVEHREPLS